MKKLIKVLICLFMIFSLVGCSKNSANYSGTTTGSAKGLGGDVTVTLTLKDGKIVDATGEGKNETEGLGTVAVEKLTAAIAETGSIKVDTMSGATISSNAVLEAAAAALTKAGLNPDDYKLDVAASVEEDKTVDTDVVIIGAGGAGMSAAIVAKDAGKNVIIVESQAAAGGNTVRSTGGMNAAKTNWQDTNEFGEEAGVEKVFKSAEGYADNAEVKALAETVKAQWDAYKANPTGYFDSIELFELDTLIGGKALNDVALVKTLAEQSESAVEWLDSIGAVLHNVASFGGASVKRIHRPVNAEGKTVSVGSYIVPVLLKNVEDRNIEIMYETTANEILTDANGAAVGIKATGKTGNTITINAKSVIVAAGGFGGNNDMVKEQNPILDGYITTNAAGAKGQGIIMATAVGAGTVDMDQIQLHPTVHVGEDGAASLITEGLRGDGAILVNKEGKRFYDEVSTRDKVSDAENNQTDGVVWLIVDQKMVDASTVIQGYIKKGFTVTGATAEELAKEMNVDEATLAETLSTWNTYVEAKNDPDFGRTSFAKVLEGPFYALTVQPGVHHTMGGLTINTNCEVLTGVNGNVIPGLFAAGEVTGGVHGANRLGGNAVADIIVFGRIAGESAANFAK